jgi:hypothetical protein
VNNLKVFREECTHTEQGHVLDKVEAYHLPDDSHDHTTTTDHITTSSTSQSYSSKCIEATLSQFVTQFDSIFDTFQSRAAKFEEDLLISFSSSKTSLVSKFSDFLLSRGFFTKFKILQLCVANYLNVFSRFFLHK